MMGWRRAEAMVGAMALVASLMARPGRAEPAKALAPIPDRTIALMKARGTVPSAPLVLRSYKKESEIEVWKLNGAGRYVYIKSFPICRWSGQLGPKRQSGDRQTPEGFYAVGPRQMNPYSHYYLSFDTGFPNAYDRAHGATGSAVMVHGTCSSMGCFAMTDKQVGELYAIARDALRGGQPAFQLQAYPFHMTARNMALYRDDKNIAFWRQLKEGSDRFESSGEILAPSVVGGRYAFAPAKDPVKEVAAKAFHAAEEARIADLVRDGSAAVRTTYSDGGQNAIFAALLKKGANLGVVSRPEALAYAGIDVTLVPGRRVRHAPRLVVTEVDWKPEPPSSASTIVGAERWQAAGGTIGTRVVPFPYALGPDALYAASGAYAFYKPLAVPPLLAGAVPAAAAVLSN